ncbi:hypothetical protein VOI54_01790 [Tamlana sp. 2201CG12-4]|uniref:hypothetical protein n=1 Tax=Tamlana sp. 2201CG12-4 TaxID=3112582 RepID=UPI002DB624E4|nr:hypothetical protein [Tamlana sp. 2201CG12-4]MEC3905742.1 hypothetical protein [Tamlana sp. 2201CG12-4]
MIKQANNNESISKLLTNERFELGFSEVKKRLTELKEEGLLDKTQFEKIINEDILLKIKYKTYKKCIQKIIIGLTITAIGFGLIREYSSRYLFISAGIILSISSLFGILSNRLTKIQVQYLKK